MGYRLERENELKLKIGEALVRVRYRRPEPGEIIEALVRKMPRGDEDRDAHNTLVANLELGKSCAVGIGEGDLVIDGEVLSTQPGSPGFREDWREVVADRLPLALIALGQHLSALPAFMEEHGPKKS